MANERILIVDDEKEIVRLCTFVLEDLGYVATGVNHAPEALALLERGGFDLLIADIKMPEMDGLALLRRARDLDPNLTVVVITGYATMDRAIEALNAGARGFVLKPFGYDEFSLAVESALAQKRREEERMRLRAQFPILEVSQMLMREADISSLAERLLGIVMRQMRATSAALVLLDGANGKVSVSGVVGLPEAFPLLGDEVAVTGLLAEAAASGEMLVVEHLVAHQGEPLVEALAAGTDEVVVLVPLLTGQKVVGVLGLGLQATPLSSDLALLGIMAGQIAPGLENARLYALEQQRTEELGRALEQQQELDQLQGAFIRNVSHELRTPLSMILGYGELITSGLLGPIPESHQEPLEIIVQRAFALRDLVENITAILQNEDTLPATEPVRMGTLVQGALDDFQVLADQAGLTLESSIEAGDRVVAGDASHLRRMVDNLVSNAIKFTDTGGTVCVRLGGRDDWVLLRVEDNGIGIPEDCLDRVFERFYQVDGSIRRKYGGSGLGLALVKEIVDTHQGTVEVSSQVGKGTVFEVTLPASTEVA